MSGLAVLGTILVLAVTMIGCVATDLAAIIGSAFEINGPQDSYVNPTTTSQTFTEGWTPAANSVHLNPRVTCSADLAPGFSPKDPEQGVNVVNENVVLINPQIEGCSVGILVQAGGFKLLADQDKVGYGSATSPALRNNRWAVLFERGSFGYEVEGLNGGELFVRNNYRSFTLRAGHDCLIADTDIDHPSSLEWNATDHRAVVGIKVLTDYTALPVADRSFHDCAIRSNDVAGFDEEGISLDANGAAGNDADSTVQGTSPLSEVDATTDTVTLAQPTNGEWTGLQDAQGAWLSFNQGGAVGRYLQIVAVDAESRRLTLSDPNDYLSLARAGDPVSVTSPFRNVTVSENVVNEEGARVGIDFHGPVYRSRMANNETTGTPSYRYGRANNLRVTEDGSSAFQSLRITSLADLPAGGMTPRPHVAVASYNAAVDNDAGWEVSFHTRDSTTYRGIPGYHSGNTSTNGVSDYNDGSYVFLATDPDTAAPGVALTTPLEGATYALNQTVSADYSCQDEPGGSGLSTCDGPVADGAAIDTGSTGSHVFTVTATDNAGNTDSATHTYTVVDDTTAPTTTATPSQQADQAGWYKQDVTVTLNATDGEAGSGVKEITYSANGAQQINSTTVAGDSIQIPVTGEGETTIAFRAADNSGNVEAEKTFTVKLDKSAPKIECASADGLWHKDDVSINCTATDATSGLADEANDASFLLSTGVASGTEAANAETGSRQVTDKAGNTATAGPVGANKVDKKAPEITISAPTEGAQYKLKQAVAASYSCSDGGSGVAGCSGPVASGANTDTATVGAKSFTVTATDNAGNTNSATRTYTVVDGGPSAGCTITGTANGETLTGTAGDDIICGGGGNDTIKGLEGNDTIKGEGGADKLTGGSGHDALYGGLGRDSAVGSAGADNLFGEDGDDSLNSKDGVSGNDSLDGGPSADTCTRDATEKSIVNCER